MFQEKLSLADPTDDVGGLSQRKMYTPVCSRKKLSLADPMDDVGGLSQRKMYDAFESRA